MEFGFNLVVGVVKDWWKMVDLGTGVGGNSEHFVKADNKSEDKNNDIEINKSGKSSSNTLVIIVILAVIIVASIAVGYISFRNANKDFIVYKDPDGNAYNIQKVLVEKDVMYRFLYPFEDGKIVSYMMRNSPYDVKPVNFERNVVEKINKPNGIKMLYVTRDFNLSGLTDSDSVIAGSEFIRLLGKADYAIYNLNVANVFTDYDYNGQTPMISCANVTSDNSVIYLKLGDANRVYSESNRCLIVEGVDGKGLILASDRLAYELMGVM